MDYFANITGNPQEKAINAWLQFIVFEDVPLAKIENDTFRTNMRFEHTTIKVVVDTMFHLTLLVEKKLAAEMKGKKGMILHDA